MPISEVVHRYPLTGCPWCGHAVDAASGLNSDDERAPEVGDYTVCIECANVSTYGIGLVLQRCPDAVWQAEPEPGPSELRAARQAVLAMHRALSPRH